MNRRSPPDIASSLSHAESLCADRGVKFTEKRKQVLTGLLESKKALSAYELTDYVRDKFNSQLPAMSVYRILDFLEEVDLVHRLDSAQKYVACSHIACDHEHELSQFLICRSCYFVEEISLGTSRMSALKRSAEKAGFRLTNQELEFDSLCGNCSE
mgnify:FL=1